MANYSLPVSGITSGSTTGAISNWYSVNGFLNKFSTTVGSGTPSTGDVLKWDGAAWIAGTASAGTNLNATADQIRYVSKSGNDANDGRSWSSAYLTLAAALTALTGNQSGIIYVGAGTYDVSGVTTDGQKNIKGAGKHATTFRLASSGTLLDVSNNQNATWEDCGFSFASSSVTGTLVKLSNCFRMTFRHCAFFGTTTASQVGIWLLSNTGDCVFEDCHIYQLAVGVQNDTTMNFFNWCNFLSNTTSIKGGDTSGAVANAGLTVRDSIFGGTGTYYIDLAGTSQSWAFDGCWLDAGPSAATGIRLGTGTFGPWLFSWTNSGSLFGNTTSLLINACTNTVLDNVVFGNDGSNPTQISVPTPANAVRGHVGRCHSVQGSKIESLVPASWDGYAGYIYQDTGKITGIETTEYQNSSPTPLTKRRIVLRVSNRASGDAQQVVTFPSAFETSFGGGTFFITYQSAGMPTMTLAATTLTIPTGTAVSNGMVVIEGY